MTCAFNNILINLTYASSTSMNFVSFLGLMHAIMTFFVDTCSDTCAENTFCIEPNTGTLDAHITHVSNSKTLLRVYFTAK